MVEENDDSSSDGFGLGKITKEKLPPIINMNGMASVLKNTVQGNNEILIRKQDDMIEEELAIFRDSNFQGQNLQARWLSSKMRKYDQPGTF